MPSSPIQLEQTLEQRQERVGERISDKLPQFNCEEKLIEAAEQTHAINPAAKILIYRNL